MAKENFVFNINKSDEGREIAAIDLGSNSFHMIVARILNGSIQILSRLKQKVKLAEGLDENGILDQAAITRGVNCLALFAERLQGFRAENVNVVGTYTLRRAQNKEEFLRQAQIVFPYPINIISGKTEAKLIYLGVSHTQPESGRKLVVDIGGGSTEMIIGDDFSPLNAESRDMGCVSFARQFFPNGEISEHHFNRAKQSAVSKITDFAPAYRKLGWQYALGSSGTIKTVHQVIAATLDPDGFITADRLDQLIKRTLTFNHFDELHLPGLNEERADVFVPGLAILSAIFDTLQIAQMRYSDGALREGVMYSLEQSFQVADIRRRTAESLARQFNVDCAQAERVHQSALLLSEQTACYRRTDTAEEIGEILLWAALLHEVGIVINHNGVQKHSAYILQHMDLPGFNKEQQRLLTLLVRYHVKSFKQEDISRFARYETQDILVALRLLRLAVILNKPRQATAFTNQIHLKIDRTFMRLEFDEGYLTHNPLLKNELSLEQKLLAEIGLTLEF